LGAEIADKVTFGTLWVACEFEIRDTRKDLKVGSEEFYKAIATRLREVIYATQVVDSTMTRSDMMRSPDKMDKMYTTFGSEPIIAYNMLLDCVSQIKNDTKEFGLKNAITKNTKKARKVVAAYVITNVMAALVESGFDAFRDDDDEEMSIEEFMKLYFKNFAFDMSIGNKLPIIKEVYSIMQGYSSSRMDTQWLQKMYYAITVKSPEKKVKYIIDAFSQVTGLPFYNLFRDTMAATNKLGLFTTEDLNEMFEDFID
jgi:Ca2+-binding EF-hand superfamily protein